MGHGTPNAGKRRHGSETYECGIDGAHCAHDHYTRDRADRDGARESRSFISYYLKDECSCGSPSKDEEKEVEELGYARPAETEAEPEKNVQVRRERTVHDTRTPLNFACHHILPGQAKVIVQGVIEDFGSCSWKYDDDEGDGHRQSQEWIFP